MAENASAFLSEAKQMNGEEIREMVSSSELKQEQNLDPSKEQSQTKIATKDLESLQEYWYPEYETPRRKEGFNANWNRLKLWCSSLALIGVLGGVVTNEFIRVLVMENLLTSMIISSLGLSLLILAVVKRNRSVYLVDFSVFQPPEELACKKEAFIEQTYTSGIFPLECCDFQKRLCERSGLGDNTYFPKGITSHPPNLSMKNAREECEMVFTGCIDDLFARTGLKPTDIDILISTCSLFNPTPSITAMIINKYKMKSSIQNFNLGGMGCSAGVAAIDMARQLLEKQFPNSNCLIFSHENITQNWYFGKLKGMLLPNVLFRMGGSCALLSNKPKYALSAKYRLHNTVRVHNGARDASYEAIFQREDDDGKIGVKLSRELFKEVTIALTKNLTLLAPSVLPISEMIKFAIEFVKRKLSKRYAEERPQFIPDFRKAFQHYCIHSGGRAIIDGIQESFKLTDEDCKPSRATLYRYGNTSSSSVWYEMNYIELAGNLKKGDRIWQLAFGSGLKVNTAVWEAM